MFSRLKRFVSVFLFALLIVIFVFALTLFSPAIKRSREVEQKLEQQQMILENKKNIQIALLREVHDLERNPTAAEKVARERFGLCKEGEIVIKYDRE